ncbi:MAG: tetratricopeptide repeat protein [Bryobacteraceae bacterium]
MLVINRAIVLSLLSLGLIASDSAREMGIAAFRQGRYSVALKNLTQAATDPGDKTAHVFLSLTRAALGECKTALPGLTGSSDSLDPVLYRLAGLAAVKCYSLTGDNADASSLLQRLEARFPNDADVLYTAAKLHMEAFNDATFAMFERVPASYRVQELSAEIFEIENRYSDAVTEYRRAIALNPSAPELHFHLGRAILLQSHSLEALQQASAEFGAELRVSPEDSASEFQLGQIAQAQGKTADAKLHLERAVSLSPGFVQALIALGKIHLQNEQYAEAISVLTRATHFQPTNESAHYALLTTYRNTGEMDKAKAEKSILDRLQKPPQGEFSDFLKRLGEKQPEQ